MRDPTQVIMNPSNNDHWVREEHRHRCGDENQQGERKEQDAVEVVDTRSPDRVEDVVQFDVNGTEG